MPCIKMDKPLVVYKFLKLCNDIHNKNVAYITTKFNFFIPQKYDFKVMLMPYDK